MRRRCRRRRLGNRGRGALPQERGRGPNTSDTRSLLMALLIALASLKRLANLRAKPAHNTASATLYVRVGPKLMELRASRLEMASVKTRRTSSETTTHGALAAWIPPERGEVRDIGKLSESLRRHKISFRGRVQNNCAAVGRSTCTTKHQTMTISDVHVRSHSRDG
jgi:hypothetical protein